MTQALLTRAEMLERLLSVFREQGFEGTTMAAIAAATGLGKASLYHHFPGGKAEMAHALVRSVCEQLNRQVFSHLAVTGDPPAQVQSFVAALDAWLDGGRQNDLLGVLALGPQRDAFVPVLLEQVLHWEQLLTHTLEAGGVAPKLAKRRARDTLVRIQGAVVISRMVGDTKPWQRLVKRLPKELLA